MEKVQQGKIKKKFPETDPWDIQLIQFYSICVKEDGLDVSDLRHIFDSLHIDMDYLFYETCVILSRVFHYMRSENARD